MLLRLFQILAVVLMGVQLGVSYAHFMQMPGKLALPLDCYIIEGIYSKILTEHLRELEADGLIKRLVEPTRPPSVTYSLTPLGESLVSVALTLKNWAEKHADEIEKIRQVSNATNGSA